MTIAEYTGIEIYVTTTAYDGKDFPEASHYNEYLAEQLAAIYPGATIEIKTGCVSRVQVRGSSHNGDLEREIAVHADVDAWESFCAGGYEAYTETVL